MHEVELKVRADHGAVRSRLEELSASRLDRIDQRDTYYDAPHRDFAETDEALRIRRTDVRGTTEVRLTYKGPLVDEVSKTRVEHETTVEDAGALAEVLEAVGFTPAATVEKTRERYQLDGYTVVLDDVVGLGEFVEVERLATAEEVDRVRDGAVDLLRELGLDPDAGIRESYLALLDAAG